MSLKYVTCTDACDRRINLPYAWNRELKRLVSVNLHDDLMEKILGKNAIAFLDLDKKLENTICNKRDGQAIGVV